MPNTLVHFGVQGALSRLAWRALDPKWVFLGCVLPDVPWILRRALLVVSGAAVSPLDLRLYVMAQASFGCTLLLCGAIALWTRRAKTVFVVLGANSMLHLLIDACEVKWGSGVHLLAPFSWRLTSFGLFWPDSAIVSVLTVAGLMLAGWELIRRETPSIGFMVKRPRVLASLLLAVLYVAMPVAFIPAVEKSDSYSIDILRRPGQRAGKPIAVERNDFIHRREGDFLRFWSGEEVRATGRKLDHSAVVSVRGRFVGPDHVLIEALHEHKGISRDAPTYAALLLLFVMWLRPVIGRCAGRRN